MATTEITARPPRDEEERATAAFWCSLVNCAVTAEDCVSCILAGTLCDKIGPWGGETAENGNRGETVKDMEKAVEEILVEEIPVEETRERASQSETSLKDMMEKAVEEIRGQMKEDYRDGCERALQSVARGEIDLVRAEKILVAGKREEFRGKSEPYINGFIDTLKEILKRVAC